MRETWYVLEDGTAVHPSEVAPNEAGVLAHKSGLVAMRADGETPRSVGVDVDGSGNRPFGGKGDHDSNGSAGGAKAPATPAAKPKDMRAQQPKQGYKTRQTKTR